MTIYHGSANIISKPVFGQGKSYNDYGLGFYCTRNIELAKEWACALGKDGFANCYELNTDGLSILYLNDKMYADGETYEKVLTMFHPMHEADLAKIVETLRTQ